MSRDLQRKEKGRSKAKPASEARQSKLLPKRSTDQAAPTTVPPIVQDVLHSPGQPLDSATRASMEPRFGHDFSEVRVHADGKAAESAREVKAQAYTVGQDVVFGAGQYSPGTNEGNRLLAHELTHTLQQSSNPTAGIFTSTEAAVSDPADGLEQVAHQIANKVIAGEHDLLQGSPKSDQAGIKNPGSTNRPLIQREAIPGSPDLALEPSPFVALMIGSLTIDGFILDKAELSSQHENQLSKLAVTIISLLRSYPTSSITIIGHADATGTEAHNLPLSEKRAEAVRSFLKSAGVPENIMYASGLGSSMPRVPTQHAERRNRRVEVIFEPHKAAYKLTAPKSPFEPPSHPSLTLPPTYNPSTKPELPDFIKPSPPAVPRPGFSLNKKISGGVDGALKPLLQKMGLSKSVQKFILDAAHDAASKGVTSAFSQILDRTNLGGTQKEALEKAFEGAMKQNF